MGHIEHIATNKKKQVLDITGSVEKFIDRRIGSTGLCYIFAKHTTSCVTTADLDPGTDLDMLDAFEAMVPKLNFRHPHDPAHVPDHIMSAIIGPGVLVPVHSGKLQLGTWQRVVLIELDGPRTRDIAMTFINGMD